MPLEYEKGQFVWGATRGDGNVGDDVTENLKTIHSISMTLTGALKGLLSGAKWFMLEINFDALNERQEADGKDLFANPRTAAPVPCGSWIPRFLPSRSWISISLMFSLMRMNS